MIEDMALKIHETVESSMKELKGDWATVVSVLFMEAVAIVYVMNKENVELTKNIVKSLIQENLEYLDELPKKGTLQ